MFSVFKENVVKKGKNGTFGKLKLKNQISYTIEIKDDKYLQESKKEIQDLGFNLSKKVWVLDIQ